jgi:hypothetical protein
MFKRLPITLLLFLLLFNSITSAAAGTTGSDPDNGAFWSEPVVAAPIQLIDLERGADGILHLVGFTNCCPAQVQYARRDLAGVWRNVEIVDSNIDSGQKWEGDLAVAGDGTAHVIWLDKEGGANYKVNYAKRSPAGTWTAPVPLSDPAHNATGLSLLANHSSQLYASWVSYGTAGFYTRYQAGGNWGAVERVDNNTGGPSRSVMLLDAQQNIHYFWYNYAAAIENTGVFYRKLTTGNTWNPVVPVSGPPAAAPGSAATLFATYEGSNLYATWSFQEGSYQNIYFADFVGGSWNSPIQLNTDIASWYPQFIGVVGNNVTIISGDNTSHTHTFRFRPSGGAWISEPLPFVGINARVLGHVSTGNITFHLVWDHWDFPGGNIEYRSRQNSGPWSAIENISGYIVGYGQEVIKQQGIHLDMVWQNIAGETMYSHALIVTTNLPPQLYTPAVFK